MQTTTWTPVMDGTAVGPIARLGNPDEPILVTALWSDVDGVVVDVECLPDTIEGALAVELALKILEAATLKPPTVRS